MNVLGISCAGNTASKLPWEILDVFAVYCMGFWWVHCPFPYGVLAVFPLGTPPLAPSVKAGVYDWEKPNNQLHQSTQVIHHSTAIHMCILAKHMQLEDKVIDPAVLFYGNN